MRSLVRAGILALVIVAADCSGDPSAFTNVVVPPTDVVSRVDVSPSSLSLTVGSTGQIVATAVNASGTSLSGKAFSYASTNSTVATVSTSGLVAAVGAGSATIDVVCEGRSASVTVTVTGLPAQVASVTVTPSTLSLMVAASASLSAVALDASGGTVAGRVFSWSSSNTTIASVSPLGTVSGVAAGNATVTATTEGRSASASVTVLAAGNNVITRVDVTPATASVGVGGGVQLTGLAYDAQGNVSTAAPYLWTTSNALVAAVTSGGLVTGLAQGTATITMSAGGFSRSATVTVVGASSNVIDVNPAVTYQTMTGWQALTQNGWLDCNQTAFPIYKDQLHDRAVNELGINRMTIMLRSGAENTHDYHADYASGLIDLSTYRTSWFSPVNDNSDPTSAVAGRFYWSFVDGQVDNAILPMAQRLQARGERLYVVLQVVDFKAATYQNTARPFDIMANPQEYAELVTEAFRHLQQRYGFVPDALEMVLEPEHTPYYAPDIGRAVVASVNRLRGAGFNPAIIAPSTTSMFNASVWYDQMLQVPGIQGMITELAYHRYVAVSAANLQAIGLRTQRDGIKSSMLEHIGSGFDALYDDLTVGMASAWQQFTLAFCGARDNPDNGGAYYQINQTVPSAPKINITNDSKLLRQVFAYVRQNAVRLSATSGNATAFKPLAFRNANGRHVVVVRTTGASSFTIRGLPAGSYGVNYGTSGTQVNVDMANQTIGSGGDLFVLMPSAGVITIYGR